MKFSCLLLLFLYACSFAPSTKVRNIASLDPMAYSSPPNRGPWKNPGFTYKSCIKKTSNRTTYPFDVHGTFRPECAPEVLYSWQTEEMIKYYSNTSTEKDLLFLERLFLWRTPIGSYGLINAIAPLRIKLKKTAVFIAIPYTERMKAKDAYGWYGRSARVNTCNYWKSVLKAPPETVFVSIHGDNHKKDKRRVHEYILCDSQAIESWSVLSPELFQEIQWELDQIHESQMGKNNGFDLLIMSENTPWEQWSGDSDFSFNHFRVNLTWMWKHMGENKFTKIFARTQKGDERETHFSVTKPTYFLRRNENYLSQGEKITSFSLKIIDSKNVGREILTSEEKMDCKGKSVCHKILSPDMFKAKDKDLKASWTCTGEFVKRSRRFPISDLFKITDFKSEMTSSQVSIDCGDTLGLEEEAPEPPKREIKILSATYGIKDDLKDVTASAASFCDGKESCEYKISNRFLGIPKVDNAGFSLQFTCENLNKTLSLDVPAPAENQVWLFGCDGVIKLIRP